MPWGCGARVGGKEAEPRWQVPSSGNPMEAQRLARPRGMGA